MVGALRVKVAAKTLELRGQEDRKCPIDLLRGVPATATGATNGRMRLVDLVEFGCARVRHLPYDDDAISPSHRRWH